MKRTPLFLAALVAASFLLAGCGDSEAPSGDMSMEKQLKGLTNGPAGGRGTMTKADTSKTPEKK